MQYASIIKLVYVELINILTFVHDKVFFSCPRCLSLTCFTWCDFIICCWRSYFSLSKGKIDNGGSFETWMRLGV